MVRLMGRALAHGARQAFWPDGGIRPLVEWDVSAGCEQPETQVLYWRASPTPRGRGPRQDRGANREAVTAFIAAVEAAFPGQGPVRVSVRSAPRRSRTAVVVPRDSGPLTLVMQLRCRCCPWCVRAKRAEWARRAESEHQAAVRTWFTTLTIDPATAHQCLTRARLRSRRRGVDFDTLAHVEQRALMRDQLSDLVTKYLKLLRKGYSVPQRDGPAKAIPGARFRYICAFEFGDQNGRVHAHLLLHEADASRPLRKARLEQRSRHHPFGAWHHGYVMPRLVGLDLEEKRAIRYVAKYLAYGPAGRVRASLRYGKREAMRSV